LIGDGKELERFFSKSTSQRFKRGETILRAGETPPGVFYLKKGFVRLYSVSESGEELTLMIFKPGDIFPISWAVADSPNNYFLDAMTLCEMWRIGRKKFVSFVSENPDELYELIGKMMVRLLGLLRRMECLVFGNAGVKIASILCIFVEAFGRETAGGLLIEVPLTHQDIADLVGIARETTSLEMGRLKDKGIIDYSGRTILIRSLTRLKRESTKSEAG